MSFGFEVHHILPRALFNNKELAEGIKRVFNTGNNSLLDYHSNHINLFDNDDMANIMRTFSHEQGHKMDVANFFGSIKHKGSKNNHPEYNKYVIGRVEFVLDLNTDDTTKKYLILDLSKELTKALQLGTINFEMTKGQLHNYFTGKLTKISEIADLKVVDGKQVYVFDENKSISKELIEFEKKYNKNTFVSTSNSVFETFRHVKDMLIKKYGSLNAISESNSPYSQKTIDLLKDKSIHNDVGQVRNIIARLVSNEAISAGAKVDEYTYKLFQESKDINDKLIFAEKIVDNDLFTEAQQNEAKVILYGMDFVRNKIPRKVPFMYQAGFVDPEAIVDGLRKVKLVIESLVQKLAQDPDFMRLAKINIASGVADFVNNVYDGLIEGLSTNNWDKFFAETKEHGVEAVKATVVGLLAVGALSLMAGSSIAIVAGIGAAGTALLTAAGLAAWGYMWYELTTKVINTDWDSVIDGFMTNILKIDELKDWFNEQTNDVIEGLADVLTQFDKWGEKNSLAELLKDYKEVLDIKENNKEVFKHLKQMYETDTKFMGTQEDDTLINTTSKGDHILYGGKGNDILTGNDKMDILIGGEGDDALNGNGGNDILGGNGGNDTLDGGEGNDSLVGGADHDTYHIKHHDTIFDSDGKGRIIFDELVVAPSVFKRSGGAWVQKDGAGNLLYTAKQQGSDLVITPSQDKSHKATIKDFFVVAKNSGDGIYHALSITLEPSNNNDPKDPKPPFAPPKNPPALSDPLVLDLNHNGQIDTLHLSRGVNFDLDGNRFAEQTSWVGSGDGFVVLDLNHNGRIDNGGELFGTDTLIQTTKQKAKDGFDALAQYDYNKDGIIDNNDSIYHQLKIWQDKNQDGISQNNELKTLKEHNIISIGLNKHADNQIDNNQVKHTYQGGFYQMVYEENPSEVTTTPITKQGIAKTLLFQVNTSNAKWQVNEDERQLPSDIQELPNLVGYGTVKSLHDVIYDDKTNQLRDLLDEFYQADFSKQSIIAEQILIHWTGQANKDKGVPVEGRVNLQQLGALKALWGKEQEWQNAELNRFAVGALEGAYKNTLNNLHSQLLSQTHHKVWLSLVDFKLNQHEYKGVVEKVYQADFRTLIHQLIDSYKKEATYGKQLIEELNFTIKYLDINHSQLYNDWLQQFNAAIKEQNLDELATILMSESISTTNASDKGDSIQGTQQNDTIDAKEGNNVIYGLMGDDTLKGGIDNDILMGGVGDDRLEGGAGSDTYVFGLGDGTDIIINNDANLAKLDTIYFTSDVKSEQVSLKRNDSNLIVQYSERDRVVVESFFDNQGATDYRIDQIQFADGTVWIVNDILTKVQQGTAEDDRLYAYANQSTHLQGQEGNDILYGENANDTLDGGVDNDKLYGGMGDDILNGGKGNDTLEGGEGDDIYVFEKNWGQDVIKDKLGLNVVYFKDINPESLAIYKDKKNLVIWQAKTENRVTINDYFIDDTTPNINQNVIDVIRFDGGIEWNGADILSKLLQGNIDNDTLHGFDGDDHITGNAGNDTLYGKKGNDFLEGGDDNDTLYGNEGDDTLYGNDGDDTLDGGEGNNTLIGGNGYDSYRIGHSANTIIRDSDFKGNIFLDANVTNAQYHHHHVWNGGHGSFASLVPDGKIISETQIGNTIKYTKQYTDQTKRVPEFIFNPAKGTFTLHKNGTSFNTNFSEHTNGFDYLKFDNIFNYDDINNLQEMDVTLSSIPKFTDSNAGTLRYEYNFMETKLSMSDFINQGTVKAIYSDNDDVIEGISEHNNYWSFYAYDANKNSISPYQLSGFDNHKKSNGDFYDDVNPDLFTGIITGDVVFAGAGNDKINTGKGASVIFAGSGDDYIVAPDTAGIDKVYGQTGNDTIYLYDPTGVIVSEKSQYPYIHTDEVYGGEGNDKIYGNEYVINGKIFGNEGDDYIELKGFMATVSGDEGDDTIILEKGALNISLGEGNDKLYIKSVERSINTSLDAGEGDDVIEIQGHLEDVKGGAGNDTITIEISNVYGGEGNDVITVKNGNAYGEEGDDIIKINSGIAKGGNGNDTIIAKNGHVILEGGAGSDTLIGGLGDDTYIVDEFDTYFEEAKDLEGGYDTIHIASNFDLSSNNFEAVTLLGNGDFSVIGDEFDNQIVGNAGNNHLIGGAGNDTLNGGDGNDHLDGGIGADSLKGGLGNDTYILDNEFDAITEYFDEGIDTLEQHTDRPFYNFDEFGNRIKTGSYHLLFDNVENLILKGTTKTAFGNNLDNTITLNEQNNFVNALSGNDTIIYQKGGGKDTIVSTDSLESKDSLVIEGYDLSEASFVRVTNTASAHDMLQIRFKGHSNDTITLIDYFADKANEQDNKIDQIIFKKDGSTTTLSQSQFEAKIIAQSQNTAPKVNKHPKPITAYIDKELVVQFDKDTIKDADAYDSQLNYKITLATKNSQGQYQPIPEWLSFDSATLILKGTPPKGVKGNLQFILWGEDSFNYSAGAFVNLSIVNAPSDTTITPKPTNPSTPTTPQTGNLVKDTKGNDTLKGDAKDTTFVYTGGKDTLTDTGGKDTLVFGNNITFNQVGSGLMQSGNDLILRVNGSTANQITLKNFFGNASNIIETIKFETGGQIDYKKIYELFGKTIPTNTSTPTPTTPTISPQNNLVGTNTADKLNGTDGNDQLQGKQGADTLNGKAGNDILIGDGGNDTLIGGTGNDLYYFTKGFGKDTIINTGGGYDNIYFEDIGFNQVGSGLVKSGNNLILKVKGTTDELTLKDFFLGGDNASLNVHFKDGGSISNTQLLNAFKSTKTATHTDVGGFDKALESSLSLMEAFKGLNTDIVPVI